MRRCARFAANRLSCVLRDYTHAKNAVGGVTARNREQSFALNLLMDPECDFVTLIGQAGTGKTLLALAAGLSQTLETKRFSEIIVTRATVPVGDDIGFLPGTEEEKMAPWMGALEDNLEVLNKTDDNAGEWGRAATNDLIRTRIRIKSLNFMRGRTFISKYLIIDEAQNLTPKQMKTLVTRAGPGTKVICLGNIAQIDTPYLTEGSSGLTHVVDRFKGWLHPGTSRCSAVSGRGWLTTRQKFCSDSALNRNSCTRSHRRSSRCSPKSPRSCPMRRRFCTSPNGTGFARSCFAARPMCSSRAATCAHSTAIFPSCTIRCSTDCPAAA